MICINPFDTLYVQPHAYVTCCRLWVRKDGQDGADVRELAMRLPNDSVITMWVALRGVREWAVGITNEKARASEGGQEV